MMKYIITGLIVLAFIFSLISGRTEEVSTAFLEECGNAGFFTYRNYVPMERYYERCPGCRTYRKAGKAVFTPAFTAF